MKILLAFTLSLVIANTNAQYVHDSLKTATGYIHYYTKGKENPVVLLPGGPGYSGYYMRGISDSLQGYKTILIDFQGTGHSLYKKPDSTWVNQDNMVQDVELLRQHLHIDKWTVLGHSWATHTALYYAIQHPKHTEKAILIATAGTDNSFLKYYEDNINKNLTQQDMTELDSLSKDPSPNSLEISKVWFRGYFYDHDKASLLFANVPKKKSPICKTMCFLMHSYTIRISKPLISASGFML
ncbi:alpha/beta hydrolase [Agriterribacter sp.]|uniref:alpha/beta fold hydrolase n=1 Tax=Agriterribacter sp. TaxID=2821509 RepID=UPI002CE8A36E|nr:alpha/beta hydrolase [Agriterribacter sp.]HRP57133.1 alpha/beta hydrolase [Agriterribacter sp.]